MAYASLNRQRSAFAAILFVLYLTFLDNTLTSPLLASIQSDLGSGVVQLQWVVGGYALAFATLMMLSGVLSDNFGRKRVLLGGIAIFSGGSVICAVAPSTSWLIAGRVIMGVGAAASEPGTLSFIRQLFSDEHQRARALGVWGAVCALALATGPVVGGLALSAWSWRGVFWFNLLLGLIALVWAGRVVPENKRATPRRLDLRGFALGSASLGLATFTTISGETTGYVNRTTVIMFGLSLLLFGAFFIVERSSPDPFLNPRYLRNPDFALALVVAFVSFFAVLSLFFFTTLYLEIVVQVTTNQIALTCVPLLLSMCTGALWSGRWSASEGNRSPMMTGCLIAGIGFLATNFVLAPHMSLIELSVAMAVAGLGLGIVIVPANASALAGLPASQSGVAASLVNTAREIGAVAAVAILGSVVNGQLTVQLTKKLIEIGVPQSYRDQILSAVTTGSAAGEAAHYEKYGGEIAVIVRKVLLAANDALAQGLSFALLSASGLLFATALVIYLMSRPHSTEVADSSISYIQ